MLTNKFNKESFRMTKRTNGYLEIPLLPNRFRYIGYVSLPISLAAGWLYMVGGRPAMFDVPVFAVVTSYIETRWFVLAQTNALDEIAVITLLLGLICLLFSKEMNETETVSHLRVKSMFYSIYLTAGICTAAYLTVFGWPAIALLAVSFCLFLLLHFVLFRLFLLKNRVEVQHQQNRNPLKKGVV
jgi:hypothetical protein